MNIEDIIKNYEDKVYEGSRVYTILYHQPSLPTQYYLVILPGPLQKNFYRQAISISAFTNRELDKAFSKNCDQSNLIRWSSVSYLRDEIYHWKHLIQFYEKNSIDIPDSFDDYVVLNSIWDYYEVVKYNYKLKKYKEN